MRIRRRLPIPLAVLLIVAAVAFIVTLRKHAPPEAARLLPGADGFLYINLKWIRTFNATNQLPSVSREPEYQKFVEETGFQFERDLDQAAFAVHYPHPDVIRGMLDRSRKLASPFGGPWLLRKFYRKVPLASLSFAILRVKPEMSSFGGLESWSLLFPKPAVAVISARYLRALHL